MTGNFSFDPTVFKPVLPASPEDARPGNPGRNAFTGPGVANVDMNLQKRSSLGDRHSIDLRIDATNAFNHVQCVLYRAGGGSVTDPLFGPLAPHVRSQAGAVLSEVQLLITAVETFGNPPRSQGLLNHLQKLTGRK